MAAMITFNCPQCKTQLKGPAEVQGKKARCKKCGHVFVLTPGAGANAPGKPPGGPAKAATTGAQAGANAPKKGDSKVGPGMYSFLSDEEAESKIGTVAKPPGSPEPAAHGYDYIDRNPYEVTDLDLAPRCPFCAKEMESADAIICLHCGYNTQTRMRPQVKRTYASTGQERLIWLLPGIVCTIVALAFVAFICYLWLAWDKDDQKYKDEWYFGAIFPMQIWGTIISAFGIFLAGRFAVIRLVLHPNPPEFEKK